MKYKRISLLEYEERHNDKFPDKPIKVLRKENRWVYFETMFGLCRKKDSDIGRNCYQISSAVDKTDYLKKHIQFIHGDRYDLSLVEYVNNATKITIICKEHGSFKTIATSITSRNTGCIQCGNIEGSSIRIHSINQFINKANEVHEFKYDYSKTVYKRDGLKLIITCPEHGDFYQTASSHKQGQGCKKCGRIKSNTYLSENPNGWTKTSWEEKANKSKYFDSFKVYIIKCYNETEEFYKIGRTFNTLKKRFKSVAMPYFYEIIQIEQGTAEEMYKLETKLKQSNKEYKYIPKIKFDGRHECFTKIEIK